jgi:hypothetical protein
MSAPRKTEKQLSPEEESLIEIKASLLGEIKNIIDNEKLLKEFKIEIPRALFAMADRLNEVSNITEFNPFNIVFNRMCHGHKEQKGVITQLEDLLKQGKIDTVNDAKGQQLAKILDQAEIGRRSMQADLDEYFMHVSVNLSSKKQKKVDSILNDEKAVKELKAKEIHVGVQSTRLELVEILSTYINRIEEAGFGKGSKEHGERKKLCLDLQEERTKLENTKALHDVINILDSTQEHFAQFLKATADRNGTTKPEKKLFGGADGTSIKLWKQYIDKDEKQLSDLMKQLKGFQEYEDKNPDLSSVAKFKK